MSKLIWRELANKFYYNPSDEKKISEEELLEIDEKKYFIGNIDVNKKHTNTNNCLKIKRNPPTKPLPPDNDECCGQGCFRCVFDIYYEKLEKYEKELEEYKKENL